MAEITVDIDLNDFEIEDLMSELSDRLGLDFPAMDTLEDRMKMEHVLKVWNKYTSAQLEIILHK